MPDPVRVRCLVRLTIGLRSDTAAREGVRVLLRRSTRALMPVPLLSLLVAGFAVACGTASPPDRPEGPASRIVSLDYCADQFVLGLADRERILALSPDAVKDFSYLRAEAAGLPAVRPRRRGRPGAGAGSGGAQLRGRAAGGRVLRAGRRAGAADRFRARHRRGSRPDSAGRRRARGRRPRRGADCRHGREARPGASRRVRRRHALPRPRRASPPGPAPSWGN